MSHFVDNYGYFQYMKNNYKYALKKLVMFPTEPYKGFMDFISNEVEARIQPTEDLRTVFTGLIVAGLTVVPVLPALTALAAAVALTAALLLGISAIIVQPAVKFIDFLQQFRAFNPHTPYITKSLIIKYYDESDEDNKTGTPSI